MLYYIILYHIILYAKYILNKIGLAVGKQACIYSKNNSMFKN